MTEIKTIEGVVVTPLAFHHDRRGFLAELFRRDELAERQFPEMAYMSETLPGVSRGPHEHRDQTDLFCFPGPGDMTLYLWDVRENSPTKGAKLKMLVGESNPCRVIRSARCHSRLQEYLVQKYPGCRCTESFVRREKPGMSRR